MTLTDEIKQYAKSKFRSKSFSADKTILINADCYGVVDSLYAEFGTFVDCWINDPPYGTTANSWDVVIPFDDYWSMFSDISHRSAPAIVFGSQPFTSGLVVSALDWHRYTLVWDKNKCGSPGLAKYRPMKVHEDIAVFSVDTHPYYPQMEEGEPYKRSQTNRPKLNNHKYGLRAMDIDNKGTRYPTSILRYPRNFSAQQQVHPTQKPTNLLDWLIQSYTKEGDILLDITAGSCSLGLSAYMLDTPCICIEKDPKYFQIGKAWLTAVSKNQRWDPAAYRRQFLGA